MYRGKKNRQGVKIAGCTISCSHNGGGMVITRLRRGSKGPCEGRIRDVLWGGQVDKE